MVIQFQLMFHNILIQQNQPKSMAEIPTITIDMTLEISTNIMVNKKRMMDSNLQVELVIKDNHIPMRKHQFK